tara:strand:- start:61 stop:417 length:357 start_codon:yes stop_codon:yes gene_type:complete
LKRSKEVRDHQISEAKRWLSLGHAPTAVATRLERKFGMSRAQTFRDVATASTELDSENMELDVDVEILPMLQQRDAMLRDVGQNWMEASDQHNPKEMDQLSRTFERLCRIGGHESHKF